MIAVRPSGGLFSVVLISVCVLLPASDFALLSKVPANEPSADEPSAEEVEQIKAAERFLTVLQKNPRRGTALDRIYGHHVEFGTLDKFIATLKEKTAADSKDGTSWMLLGLMEAQRGQDGNSADAFRQAEVTRPTDAMACYYLAQSLLRIGQNEEAITAFELAIERKPQRNDLLEIFQQLGRVHQRAQRTEEAMKVWSRLELLFPDDPRVLEQIAVTLAEEGDSAQALIRYERLAKLVKDDYRRTMYLIAVAELKIKTSQKDGGIADLETIMAELDPDSWIYKDVRRRIDDVFLRSGDQDSLVKYYQKWIDSHPEDVEGMARLAKFLAQSARVPEATEWMEKALKLAPSRTDLRKSFIDQLVDNQRTPEAIKQYEQLAVAAPGNPDFLRDWGKLVLKDKSQDLDARKKEAARIWNQIVASRPDDAITTAQVADLFRQSNLNDEAMTLYQKAVTLAPADPQYREYLGEFYHIQKMTDDALKTWASIAEGKQRTSDNVARLAEVYNSFGYLDQAVKEITDACKLAPKEFILQMRAADYHKRAAKYDEALTFLSAAEMLAQTDDERDSLIRQRIEVFQSSQRMEDEIQKLVAAIQANATVTPADWALLARYYEANRQWTEATESVEKGLTLDPKSVPTLIVAARIAESSGNFGQAADYSRRLAETDRRSRGDHLMNVARLEVQMGRSAQALAAANELIVSAPGNTDNYEFLAQMCFRLGKSDEGLEALRKAVRINPNEPHLIMALASALADQLRTDEAIAVYWRAFDKSETLDDKTSLTQKLVPLYEQINQLDKLIERFERERREEEKRREMTICLAQAWQTSGDLGTARQELEQLLGENTRDTNLLQQLSKLCEANGDLDAAIGYQRQLIAVAPGHETEFPLVKLLQTRGDRDEATEILVKLTAREDDPARLLRSIDSLLSQGAYEAAIRITEPLLSQQRDDWELLYREGVAWAKLEKPEEAKNRFERILSVTLPHDSQGLFASEEFKKATAKAKSENLKGNQTQGPQKTSPLNLSRNSNAVQTAVGLRADNSYYNSGGRSMPQVWTPREFGTARMACFGWMLKFEEDAASNVADNTANEATASEATTIETSATPSVVNRVVAKIATDDAPRDAIYDRLYVAGLKSDYAGQFEMARRLLKTGGADEQRYFLTSIQTRNQTENTRYNNNANQKPTGKPLSDDDIALMLKCYEELSKPTGEEQSPIAGGQIVYSSDGNAYINVGGSWVMLGGIRGGGKMFVMTVVNELKLAGREAEANVLFDAAVSDIKTAADAEAAFSLYTQMEKTDALPATFDRWISLAKEELSKPDDGASASTRRPGQGRVVLGQMSNSIMQWMGTLGAEEENVRVLDLLAQSLDLATIEARQRVAATSDPKKLRAASAARSNSSQMSFSWYYGKENRNYIQIEYPTPSLYLEQVPLMLLREVHEVLKRNDVLSDLAARLRERVAKAAPEDVIFEKMYLASALWWADEQDDAVELIAEVTASQKDDPNAQFELAQLRMQRGDFDDALTIVDSIPARDQKLLQRRELMALDLAARVADYDRARAAAERLFGLRLDAQTQLSLVSSMKRLGLNDLADAVIARTERQAGNQPTSLASLMMLYQSQGKTDHARQLAHMLLRKTVSSMSMMANSGRNPLRNNSGGDQSRTQALQVLQQTGELKSLIAQLEEQLTRSPDANRLAEQLIEFYGVAGERDKVAPLLIAALKKRPDDDALRLQLAKHYQQTNKQSEACDQYLELMKRKPDWVFEDFYQIRNLFQATKRNADVVAVLKTMNLKQIRQPYYVVDFVGDLLNDEANEKLALEILDKVLDAFPHYRANALSNIRNPKLWQSEGFFELGKKMILPTEADLQSNPWAGLSVYSYSQDGTVDTHFHNLLRGLQSSPRLDDLEQAIQASCEEHPTWYTGKAMIALIDLHNGKKDEARVALEALVGNEDAIKTITSDAGWIIGQELYKFTETAAVAQTLLEKAMTRDNGMNEFQYTPGPILIKAYVAAGRREEARKLLVKSMQNVRSDGYQPDYDAYRRTQNSLNGAKLFQEMKFTVDAVKVYQRLLNNEADLKLAGQVNRNEDYYLSQAKAGLSKAIESLDSTQAAEAVDQLLAVQSVDDKDEKSAKGHSLLDLLVRVPSSLPAVNSGSEKATLDSISSGLVQLLVTISTDEKVKTLIEEKLAKLVAENPDDLSIAIAVAAYHGQMKDSGFPESIETLAKLLKSQPLDDIAEGRRPNSRHRRQAAERLPIWIVAKAGLKDATTQQAATEIAEAALQAACRQTGFSASSTILFEWSELLRDAGKKDEAEARLTELLKLATERPTRKAKTETLKDATGRRSCLPERTMFGSSFLPESILPCAMRETLWGGRGWIERSEGSPGVSSWRSPTPATRIPPGRRDPHYVLTSLQTDETSDDTIVPPLTISQFRVAMRVAKIAAENDMAELSLKAVREAMLGGTPVPDVAASTDQNSNRRVIRSGQAPTTAASQFDQEIVTSLQQTIAKWHGEKYPAAEVYTLFTRLVFPQSRPAETLLYPDNSQLRNAVPKSLAPTIVEWARQAKQQTDLQERIQNRNQGANLVASQVLLTTLELEESRTDAAAAALNEILKAVQTNPGPEMLQLACHAAIPAVEKPELAAIAYSVLKLAIQTPWNPNDNGNSEVSSGKLDQMVNRYMAQQGDIEGVRQYFDTQQSAKALMYSRYGGDYGLYRQWNDLAGFASEAARNGIPSIAADYLGRAADFDAKQYSPPDLSMPLSIVARHFSTLEPRAQFEAWRDWTMPVNDRQTVRLAAQFVKPANIPTPFLQLNPIPGTPHQTDLICNLTELLAAAAKCGALDELKDAVNHARDEKLPNSEFLHVLYLIETGDTTAGIPAVQQMLDSMEERNKSDNGRQRRTPMADYVIYRRSLQSPAFADFFASSGQTSLRIMLEALISGTTMAHLNVDFSDVLASRTGGQLKPGDETGLADWLPASANTAFDPSIPPWWVAQDNMLFHLAGDGTDLLYFAYPVEGNFEFTVDCLQRSWGECDAGYGGVAVLSQAFGDSGSVLSFTGEDSVRRPVGLKRNTPNLNKVRIQSLDGKLRYFLNEHLAYEETLTGTCPWITLASSQNRVSMFRNPAISGTPSVPKEVRLLTAASMEGWSCPGFGDRRPSPRVMAGKPKSENDSGYWEQRQEPTKPDWSNKNGVLTSQPNPDAAVDRQSRIRYCRPLRDGESLKYEFFYEPESIVAHPMIGRLAMLLQPDGVMTHWLAEPDWDDAFSGILLDNAIAEPDCRRGPSVLPLKPSDWNTVELTLKDGSALISLNGTLVFERPVPEESDTRVGMFRYQRQESRIRNAVLTGPWPESLSEELRRNMLMNQKTLSPGDQKMLAELTPEQVFEVQVPELLAHVRTLPDDEAFQVLRDWVLPSATHDSIRLSYRAIPIAVGTDAQPASPSDIESPALELVQLAQKLNRTDELLNQVSTISVSGQLHSRNLLAIQTMLLLSGSDMDQIAAKIKEVTATVQQGLSPLIPLQQRAAEILVACQAARRQETQHFGTEVASALGRMQRDEKFRNKNDRYSRIALGALGPLASDFADAAESPNSVTTNDSKQWAAVQYLRPNDRNFGERTSSWRLTQGQAHHVPGARPTHQFFRSPLRGKFEILAQRSSSQNSARDGEFMISWGAFSAVPRKDLKAIRIAKTLTGVDDRDKTLELPGWDEAAEFQIAVDGHKVATSVNGVPIHEEVLVGTPSPWIVLRTPDATDEAMISNLRIVGTPEIPEEIDLVDMSGWACWRSDVYGESHSIDSADEKTSWKKAGDEIVGQLRTDVSAKPLESLLMYQRPMLEDGEIEFESFWVPGEQEVHPSVGRSAILIQPDGAKLHILTDAQYETRDLAPDNVSPVPGAADKIDLKANDWNQIRLVLKGDQLTVFVNGSQVATHEVSEPATERFFGLFRYADKDNCRVRKVMYRGNWPRTLPPITEQFLATQK